MSRPLEGKVALITGSSKGIGRATAFRLAQDGAKVVVNYSRGTDAAAKVVEDIGSEYAFAIQADASKIFDIEVLIGKTVAKFGKIDILVASAGVLPMKDLENTTEEDFDRAFALNVKGPYFLVQVRNFFLCYYGGTMINTTKRKLHHISATMHTLSSSQVPYVLHPL